MSRLKDKYFQEIQPKIMEEFQIKNKLASPRLKKIVMNVGIGDAKENQGLVDKAVADVTALAGQKPVVTLAKHSISGFKLGKGQPVGISVTLRGNRMYDFFDKLVTIVLPKVRDFRGLTDSPFDAQGNYTLGLHEQTIFPEVAFPGAGQKSRGIEISIVTTATSKEIGKRLLEFLGMPFKKEEGGKSR